MKDNGIEIRRMTREELDVAINWAADEGWNPGLNDGDVFFTTDPGGYYMAFENGNPIGCISTVSYGREYSFIGFFIVVPEMRGHSVGLKLAEVAVANTKAVTIGIDGVEAKVKNYHSQYGFEFAHNNIRFEMKSGKLAHDTIDLVNSTDVDFESLSEYDSRFFPAKRDLFLSKWINMPDSFSLVCINGGMISGFGLIRKCRNGYKIGPLFAETPAVAENLFRALVSETETGSPVYLDVPEPNENALKFTKKYNITSVFKTARMYRGVNPNLPLDKIYGITTFELG